MRTVRRLLLVLALGLAVLVGEAVFARVTVPDDDYRPPPRGPLTFGDEDAPSLALLVLGDSTGTGRGAGYADGIAVGAAEHLADCGLRVALTNLAVSGARYDDVREEQLAEGVEADPDVVLIAAGANDALGLRSGGAVAADLRAIARALRAARPGVAIVITGAPDVGAVPRLAQPLRALAGWRAGRINDALDDAVAELGLVRAPIAEQTGDAFRADDSLFAEDDFHPDAEGYATWRPVVAAAIDRALAAPSTSAAACGR